MAYFPEDQAGTPDCPNCGGALIPTDEYGVFTCEDCGETKDFNPDL